MYLAMERGERCELLEMHGGRLRAVALFRSLEAALYWIAGTVAARTGKGAEDFEAVPVKVAAGLYQITVNEF